MGSTRLREVEMLNVEHLVGGVLFLTRDFDEIDLGAQIVDGGVEICRLPVHLQDLGVDCRNTRIDVGLPPLEFVERRRVAFERSLDCLQRCGDVGDLRSLIHGLLLDTGLVDWALEVIGTGCQGDGEKATRMGGSGGGGGGGETRNLISYQM